MIFVCGNLKAEDRRFSGLHKRELGSDKLFLKIWEEGGQKSEQVKRRVWKSQKRRSQVWLQRHCWEIGVVHVTSAMVLP